MSPITSFVYRRAEWLFNAPTRLMFHFLLVDGCGEED